MKSDKTQKKYVLVKGLVIASLLLLIFNGIASAYDLDYKLHDTFGRPYDDAKKDLFPPKKPATIPEFPSYAVPVVTMLGIFLILGSRKND